MMSIFQLPSLEMAGRVGGIKWPQRQQESIYDTMKRRNESAMPNGDAVAELLRDWAHGDEAAYARLFSHVYTELKRVAHNELRKEPPDPLLQTTGLVHEAFLRLHRR